MIKKFAREIWKTRRLPEALAVTLGQMDPEEAEGRWVQTRAAGRLTKMVVACAVLIAYVMLKPRKKRELTDPRASR